MIKKSLTLDDLRKRHTMIHYFGLGFVQVKMGPSYRCHFYHPSVPAFVDGPHDHRYSFTSTVHRGSIRNTIYEEASDEFCNLRGKMIPESCREGVPPSDDVRDVRLKIVSSFITYEGSAYYLKHDTLHSIEPLALDGKVITSLMRNDVVKTHARVFRPEKEISGNEKLGVICPFSKKMSDDDLWAIVADCLGE